MSKGDHLASGGKAATFQAARIATEFESDMKIQNARYVGEKYGISPEAYSGYERKLKNGEQLPDLQPLNTPGETEPGLQPLADEIDPGPVPCEAPEPVFMPEGAPHIPNAVLPYKEKPAFGYEGDPTGDCVLVQRVEREHTSNLILPDSLKAKSDIGYIKAVGEAVKYYKPGNLVLFDKFASHGSDISLIDEDGVERAMLLLREFDILMRLKKVSLK